MDIVTPVATFILLSTAGVAAPHLSDVSAHGEVDLEVGRLLVQLALDHLAVGALDDQGCLKEYQSWTLF